MVVNGQEGLSPIIINTKAGKSVILDASRSTDPDGDGITYKWWQQPEIGGTALAIEDSEKSKASISIPADAKGKEFHIICEVHNNGPFRLAAYRRVIIHVKNTPD